MRLWVELPQRHYHGYQRYLTAQRSVGCVSQKPPIEGARPSAPLPFTNKVQDMSLKVCAYTSFGSCVGAVRLSGEAVVSSRRRRVEQA